MATPHLPPSAFSTEKLSNTNYIAWKTTMVSVLRALKLEDTILNSGNDGSADAVARENEAYAYLSCQLDRDNTRHTYNSKTTYDLWQQLKRVHEDPNKRDRLYIKGQLLTRRYVVGQPMQAHINDVLDLNQRLASTSSPMSNHIAECKAELLADIPTLVSADLNARIRQAVMKAMDKLAKKNDTLSDHELAQNLLITLPYHTFQNIIQGLEAKGDSLTFNDVSSTLLGWESRAKLSSADQPMADSLTPIAAYSNTPASRPPFPAAERPVCSHCKKVGHLAASCWLLHPHLRPARGKRPRQAPAATSAALGTSSSQLNPYLSMPTIVCSSTQSTAINPSTATWHIDSGASLHFCNRRDWFDTDTFDQSATCNVVVGDGRVVRAWGRGDVTTRTITNGRPMTVTQRDVWYVPSLALNLLSVARMTMAGYSVTFNGAMCTVSAADGTAVYLARRDVHNGIYKLEVLPLPQGEAPSQSASVQAKRASSTRIEQSSKVGGEPLSTACSQQANNKRLKLLPEIVSSARVEQSHIAHDEPVTAAESTQPPDQPSLLSDSASKGVEQTGNAQLWHRRLGHLHSKAMTSLQRHSTGMRVKGSPSAVCEGCLKGKQHRMAMPRESTHRAKQPLELVHSDVCGPMATEAFGGQHYFVTFIDDWSRLVVVFLIKQKSDVLAHFTAFKAWAENQSGHRLKALRSDGGGEYVSTEFDQLLTAQGIERQKTPPRTPEHNGVAERANRTLMEAARCMLHAASLPPAYWGDAVLTAAYLRNRSPSRSLKGQTPYQRWQGELPDLSHLRVFGCTAHVHVADELRHKLSTKSVTGIFVGYATGSKAYRVRVNNKVIVSRDVVFDESMQRQAALPTDDTDQQTSAQPTSPTSRTDQLTLDDVEDGLAPYQTRSDSAADSEQKQSAPPPRRSNRAHVPVQPHWHAPYYTWSANCAVLANTSAQQLDDEPLSLTEARTRPDSKQWEAAAEAEMNSIKQAGTWELTELPPGRRPIGCKWVFKVKRTASGSIDRYKARLVAKGFSQREGVDYHETFAPVAKFQSIRALLALGAHHDLLIHQMDVKTAYLNGDLQEEVYMQQPDGYVMAGQEQLVCKLKKSLYGLKQAGRAWYEKIDDSLHHMGYEHLSGDHCIYRLTRSGAMTWIALYVDDLLILSDSAGDLAQLKQQLADRFEMKDMGEAQFVLGIQIKRDRSARTLTISQSSYVEGVVRRHGMDQSKPVTTPMDASIKLVRIAQAEELGDIAAGAAEPLESALPYQSAMGAVMYAMLGTRPDIAFAVTTLSQFSSQPSRQHWTAIKRLLRYLHGTTHYSITYRALPDSQHAELTGYCDADWASSVVDRRSVTGFVFLLAGGAVNWQAKKQPTVALSTVEAEYMASTQSVKDAMWWRQLLSELYGSSGEPGKPTTIFADSQGSIALSKNPTYHARTKHIDVQHHWVRERVQDGSVNFVYVDTGDMAADVLTKALPREQHNKLIRMLGMELSTSGSVGD